MELILILILVLILIVLLILVLIVLVVHFNLSCGINLTFKPTALRLFTTRIENIRQSSIYLDSTSSLTALIIWRAEAKNAIEQAKQTSHHTSLINLSSERMSS